MPRAALRRWGYAQLVLMALAGCGTPPPPPPPPPPPERVLDLGASSFSVTRVQDLVADGTDWTTVTVALKDTEGEPFDGQQVRLEVTGGGNLASAPATTNASGQATFTLRSTVAESKTVRVLVNPGASQAFLSGQVEVTFVAGPPGVGSSLTLNPSAARGDDVETITATLTARDSNGNLITAGQVVTFLLSGSGNTVSPDTGTTDAQGVLTTVLRSSQPGLKTLTARMGGYDHEVQVLFRAGDPDATRSTFAASPNAVAADGAETSTLVLDLKDASGTPTAGEPVTLSVTGGSVNLSPESGNADDNGRFVATVTSSSSGTRTFTATVGSFFTKTAQVTFNAGSATQATSSLTAAPQVLAAGTGVSALTVTVRDARNNPLALQSVTFSASTGVVTFVPPSGQTDENGRLTTNFSSETSGAVRVSAQVGTLFALEEDLMVNPGAPSAASSSLTPSSPTAPADDATLITFTARFRDGYGNAVSGAGVSWSVSGTGHALSQGGANTNTNGEATATLRASLSGTRTVTVTANGHSETAQVTFNPGVPVETRSAITFSSPTLEAGATGTVSVTLRDANGNPTPGQAVTVRIPGAGNDPTLANLTTDENGVASLDFLSTLAGSKTITAESTEGWSLQASWTVVPSTPTNDYSTLEASLSTCPADDATLVTFTLTVRDLYGNLVPAAPVGWTLDTTNSNDSFNVADTQTDAFGVLTATLRSRTAEIKQLTADSGSMSESVLVLFTAGAPVEGNSELTVSTIPVVADGTVTQLTVTLRDQFGNVVPDQPVTFSVDGFQTTLDPVDGVATTSSDGTATVDLSSTYAEEKDVTVTVGTLFSLTEPLTFSPGEPDEALSTIDACPAPRIADETPCTVSVVLRDAYWNLISGESVTFTTDDATADTLDPELATTNTFGQATSSLSTTRAGTKTLTASVGDVSKTLFVAFSAGPAEESATTFAVTPSSLEAGDGATTTLAVAARDQYGNAVEGAQVTLSLSISGSPSSASGTTDASGLFSALFTSAQVGPQNGVATFSNPSFTKTTPVVFTYAKPKMVAVTAPASPAGGCVSIPYTVRQAQNRRVNLRVEYSLDGATYFPATQAAELPDTSGIEGVAAGALPAGTAHTFVWNSVADLGRTNQYDVQIRITPSVRGIGAGPAFSSGSFQVHNALGFSTTTINHSDVRNVAAADFDRDGYQDVLLQRDFSVTLYLSNGGGSYVGTSNHPTGDFSSELVVADFNRDGWLDFATPNYSDSNVSVYHWAGTSFGAMSTLNATYAPSGAAVADFDRDGWMDLVAVTIDGNLNVFRNTLGTLNTSPSPFPTLSNAKRVVTADFNRDGAPDVAVSTVDTVRIHLNAGNGWLDLGGTFAVMNGARADLVAADFNRDGIVDLVSAGGSFLRGVGDGTFQPQTSSNLPNNVADLAAADFDSDGLLDVAVVTTTVTGTRNFVVYRGVGDGTFSTGFIEAITSTGQGITTADLNEDGRLDVVLSTANNVQARLATMPHRCDPNLDAAQLVEVGMGPGPLAAGDLDGDGRPDLVSSVYSGVAVSLGRGNGTLRNPVVFPVPPSLVGMALGDIDGDGDVDAVTASSNLLHVLAGDGDGNLSGPFSALVSGPLMGTLTGADLDADGRMDLVAGRVGVVSVLRSDGTLAYPGPVDVAAAGDPTSLATGDFDGDGRLDVAAVGTGFAQVFLGNGAWGLSAGQAVNPGATVGQVAAGDVNGDGRADLLFAVTGTAEARLALATGGGTFGTATAISLPGNPTEVALGDLNGDGLLDVVASLGARDSVATRLGLGDGTFLAAAEYKSGRSPKSVLVHDYSGDGLAEVAVASVSQGSVRLFATAPSGALRSAVESAAGSASPSKLGVGDFNRDGKLDLLVGSDDVTYPSLWALFGNGDGTFQTPFSLPLGGSRAGSKHLTVEDFNQDGYLDFAVYSPNNEELSFHFGFQWGFNTSAVGPFPGVTAMAAGEYNGDGRRDLVVSHDWSGCPSTYCASLFQGGWDWALYYSQNFDLPVEASALALRDVNSDGRTDLVAAGWDGMNQSMGVLYQTPSGVLGPAIPHALGSAPADIRTGDVNNDGHPDICLAEQVSGVATFLFSFSTGAHMPSGVFGMGGHVTRSLAQADLDGDGKLDAVSAISSEGPSSVLGDYLTVRVGDETGNLGGPSAFRAFGTGARVVDAVVADFDRDGKLDVVTAHQDAKTVWFMRGR